MIHILRPTAIPSILAKDGVQATAALCQEYDADAAGFRSGSKKHTFDRRIYGDVSIKAALKSSQHEKCCFCESKVSHVSAGDVEHFRPKAAWRQNDRSPLHRPGYYWLAYEWSNLLFCCDECNRRAKRNCFPLVRTATRATCHRESVAAERSLLIHPAEEDPESYISFRQEYAYSIDNSRRGAATIKFLQLNDRESLVERRRDHLAMLTRLKQCHDVLVAMIASDAASGKAPRRDVAALVSSIAADLEGKTLPTSEYSSLAKGAV